MNHEYRIEHDWGELPDHILWGKTHGVVIDRNQHVHIAHTSCEASPCKDCVIVFDRDGRFVRSWGEQFYGHAHGLRLVEHTDGNEYLYLTDDEKGVYKCSLGGDILQHVGVPGFYEEEGLPFGPANVCVTPAGELYLVEGYGSSYVLHFDAVGTLVNRFGGKGDAPEHTKWAHGIFLAVVDNEPLLHIAVDEPSLIKRFRLDGSFHSVMPGEYLHPRTIVSHGDLWAIPEMQGRLTLVDQTTGTTTPFGFSKKSMEEIFSFRERPRTDFPAGRFVSAHDVAFFSNGDMIVVEWVEVGRVNKVVKH